MRGMDRQRRLADPRLAHDCHDHDSLGTTSAAAQPRAKIRQHRIASGEVLDVRWQLAWHRTRRRQRRCLRALVRTPIRVQNSLLDDCTLGIGQRQSIGKHRNRRSTWSVDLAALKVPNCPHTHAGSIGQPFLREAPLQPKAGKEPRKLDAAARVYVRHGALPLGEVTIWAIVSTRYRTTGSAMPRALARLGESGAGFPRSTGASRSVGRGSSGAGSITVAVDFVSELLFSDLSGRRVTRG
jgi:hypothetical protein